MTTLEKFNRIASEAKGGCTITINDHRSFYEDLASYISEKRSRDWFEDNRDLITDCIKTDSIIEFQVYPNTPIGFNVYFAPTFEQVVDIAYKDLYK